MQPQESFVSAADYSFGHTLLGTLLGTLGAFFARSVQKMEGKRDKATVFLTVASSKRHLRAGMGAGGRYHYSQQQQPTCIHFDPSARPLESPPKILCLMFSAPGSFVRIAAANLHPVPPADDDLEPFRRRMQNAPTDCVIPGFLRGSLAYL